MALEYISEILAPRLFAASVQSTLLVAVVWALCRLLPRLPATARCWLWWLVALQLVVGVLWTSPLALPLLPAEPIAQAVIAPLQSLPAAAAPVTTDAAASLPLLPQTSSLSSAIVPPPSAWSWPLTLSVLWLLGLSFMITRTLLGYLATRRLLRESVPCHDATLTQALKLAAEAHGLRGAPTLRLSSAISSPQLIGPWSPVLMLPAHRLPSLGADELDMALTHELTHLQRGDLWWGLLPALAQHVFFFHPLAHLAAREYAFAREAACDAAVLAGNPHCAGDYGRLLVRLGVAARPSAGLASASPTFLMLKRRLLMLQQSTSPLRASALVLTIAVALIGVVPYRVTAQAAQTTASAPASVSAALAVSGPAATPVNTTALQTIAASRIVPASPAAHALSKALPAQVEAADSAAPAAAPASASAALAVPVPMPMPMPMETPITKTSSQTMAASRIVPAPPAAPAPPKAPSAPSAARAAAPAVPPAPPLVSEGSWTHGNSDYAHVLIDGNTTNAVGNTDDLRAAKSQQRNGEALLWVRKGGSKYVVRDPATLQRLKAAYAPVAKFGKEQGQLGAKQGELGAQQGELGARQGQIGAQQGELAARYAEAVMRSVGGDADARSKAEAAAAEKRLEALGQQQDQLGREQHALGSKQEEIGRQQQALGERQRLASEAAQREADRLIDAAIANGLAQRLQ